MSLLPRLCSASCTGFLASRGAARRVQDCDSRPPVHVRQHPGDLADDCQLVADARVRQLRSADTRTLVRVSALQQCQQSHAQQLFWRQDLCRRRTTSLEQSAARSQTMWAVIRPVQAVTEDIVIRTVRPRRSVNCFNCAE